MRKDPVDKDATKCFFKTNRKGKIQGTCLKCGQYQKTGKRAGEKCSVGGLYDPNTWCNEHVLALKQKDDGVFGPLFYYACRCGYTTYNSDPTKTCKLTADMHDIADIIT